MVNPFVGHMNYISIGRFRIERRVRIPNAAFVMAVLFLISLPFVTPRVAASDEIEYFSYLPSILFDGDLNFRNQYEYFCNLAAECVSPTFRKTFLDQFTATGLQINFGPMGTAVLWLPFYLVGHIVALGLQNVIPAFAANGYSTPYVYAVCVGSLFYGWTGMYLAYRLARSYFAEWSALGAALVILFATNAVYYMYVAPAFSHAASLFASALFVYVWWRTRESRARGNWGHWFWLGASGGLMTMVREQEAVFFVMPLVEGVYSGYRVLKLGEKWTVLRTWIMGAAVMVVGAFLVFIPQLVSYRILNGNFLPARNVTDKFTWDGVHILDVLFSDFHGLFTWTPVLVFAVIGLVLLWRYDRLVTAAFLLALTFETYLLGSFSTWFGGAGFGGRRFINCTVLFVVGLAAFVESIQTRVPRPLLAVVGALLIVWNLFFIIQFVTGMVPREQPVDMLAMAQNQFLGVPPRLVEIAERFVMNRGSFFDQ